MISAPLRAARWMALRALSTLAAGSASQRICTRPSVNVRGSGDFIAGLGLRVAVRRRVASWYCKGYGNGGGPARGRGGMADRNDPARHLKQHLDSLRAAGVDWLPGGPPPPAAHPPAPAAEAAPAAGARP